MNSPLIWAGSKRWHAPLVDTLYDRQRPFVELFAGSLAVSFALELPNVAAFDANAALMNFYRRWRDGYLTGIHEDFDPAAYYDHRARFNAIGPDEPEAAELFYVLNRWGYNGLWRVNGAGKHNVPPRPVLHSLPPVTAPPGFISNWYLATSGYDDAFLSIERASFIYADPPYDGGFTKYTAGGFTWDQQCDLAQRLLKHDGPVVLMNAGTPRIVDLYLELGYHVTMINSQQAMHRSRGRTDAVPEVMATLALPRSGS